jgi:hypothetical protein
MTSLVAYLQTRVKIVISLCWTLLALIAFASLLIDKHHAHTWVEQYVPFFWSLFGFAAATTIIGIARWLGRSGIQAEPDFYHRSPATPCEEEK